MNSAQRNELIRSIASSIPINDDGALLKDCPKLMADQLEKLLEGSAAMDLDDWNDYVCSWLLDDFYPSGRELPDREARREAVLFYLDVLNELFAREEKLLSRSRTRSLVFLSSRQAKNYDSAAPYLRLLKCLKEGYLYAFMRLHREVTGYETLGHISGVSYVAMYIAKQLLNTKVKVDLALVSGAAILHDIGKYGCRPHEICRVPYLHYYYTYEFAQRMNLGQIGAIASSHSVWDLELENLSVESLLLIYADFRVKSVRLPDNTEQVHFWSLKESYDIILSKLDNVDDGKRARYAKVYAKLKDFEDYLVSLGVSTDLESPFHAPPAGTPYSLMNTDEMVQAFKFLAISQNLKVMYTTSHDVSFISLLEDIRGEKDWRHVRAFLTVLDEYSGYLSQEQKLVILDFLYEMLSHQDGDIRRQSARIAASVIAGFDITFRKELPQDVSAPRIGRRMVDIWSSFFHRMLFPSHMMTQQHRRWVGYSMKTVVRTLLSMCGADKRRDVLNVIMEHYKSSRWEPLTRFLLLDCLPEIPYRLCSANQQKLLFRFARQFLISDDLEIRVCALRFLMCWLKQGCACDEEMLNVVRSLETGDSSPVCVRYLIARIRSLALGEEMLLEYDEKLLYIDNQRSEIPWIYKLVNLEILQQKMLDESDHLKVYQYASHLLNLLQFTTSVTNKLQAGENLVRIMPHLSASQRYEIVLELVRALSMGRYSVSKYIPQFMGRIYILMDEDERLALLEQFKALYGSPAVSVPILTLETVSVILKDPQISRIPKSERIALEGILFSGTVHFNDEVAREAFYFLGEGLFGSPDINIEQKKEYFTSMARKVLTFIQWDQENMLWYYNAASLNHIYRFISDYLLEHEAISFEKRKKIAFFPGTFDPFSLGHKAIVREIASMGFHVFLAVDEFSWSKNTQPYKIRRKIMVMSVADLDHVFLFPIEIPVNIACPDDLKRLRECFPGEEVYIVAGSDVIEHASAYRAKPSEHSVHSFPHIIFARNTEGSSGTMMPAEESFGRLKSDILWLKLPAYFENMSSTRIRRNVSDNKDIADLVENVVQNYIYDLGLYTMDPIYKRAARTRAVDTVIQDTADEALISDLEREFGSIRSSSGDSSAGNVQAVILKNDDAPGNICGAVLYHNLEVNELLRECSDIDLAAKLRDQLCGPACVITKILGKSDDIRSESFTALCEMLAHCQEEGFSYAVCFHAGEYSDILSAFGFLPHPALEDCYIVDMRHPLVLFFDTPSFIKDPFLDDPKTRRVLWECNMRLRREIAALFPGQLVLCFDSEVMNHRLIQMIMRNNPLSKVQYSAKALGDHICVPYGKILKGVLVPNCVTKDLNTEKLYDIDMEHFEIREFPQYTPLNIQLRTIKSFMRPVILADDLYHKGYRLEAVNKVMKQEGVVLDKLIVGICSGRGRDLAGVSGVPIESVYFVPNMRSWLIESDLYPFIGGDGIRVRDKAQSSPSLPSVNSILPYQFPSFMKGASMAAFYSMSGVCLENAKSIFLVLEKLYQKKYHRKLTLSRIKEVLAEPRHPDTCIMDSSVIQESPSALLDREIQKLRRLRHLLDGEFRL
ncbi:MAG: hypothetical protein J6E32_02225 [Lachnospiraceae bacterium]|nr:hypothetical protein [Lachnospiraceae bacterium]